MDLRSLVKRTPPSLDLSAEDDAGSDGWHPVEVCREVSDWFASSQVVFHGVNKSGSLALAQVIRQSFFRHNRADQFFSHYHQTPAKLSDLIRILECSTGPNFFVGHYLYGAVRCPVPGRALFTQFRHPLPRIVSCYQWLLNKHESSHGSQEGFPTLKEFVEASKGKGHSQIIQFGVGFGMSPKVRADQIRRSDAKEIFEKALDAVERDIDLVGIAEYLEETIYLLAGVCGLTSVPVWEGDDRNVGRPLIDQLPNDVCDLIREVYYYDFQFYDRMKQRFFDSLQGLDLGPAIQGYRNACQGAYKDRIL